MLDHISVGVSQIDRAKRFYDAVLKPLGYQRLDDSPDGAGYGPAPLPAESIAAFWIAEVNDPQMLEYGKRLAHHAAFRAPDRLSVDAFHTAGLKAGGKDNGAPGLRPHYGDQYYAAFLFDPDGNKIEAVCHKRV